MRAGAGGRFERPWMVSVSPARWRDVGLERYGEEEGTGALDSIVAGDIGAVSRAPAGLKTVVMYRMKEAGGGKGEMWGSFNAGSRGPVILQGPIESGIVMQSRYWSELIPGNSSSLR